MRWLGLVLVALALFIAGLFAAEHRRYQSKIRHGLFLLLEKMHFSIEHFTTEQEALFASLQIPSLSPCSFLEDVKKEVAHDPVLALERAVKGFDFKGILNGQEQERFRLFASRFGLLSKKRQLLELEEMQLVLRDTVARDERTLAADLKLYRLLGAVAGLGFLIFLM